VTEGRRPHRPRAPDTVGADTRQPPFLRGIANQANADKRPRGRDRYRCLNVERLLEGWGDLNKDAASGVDGVTWHA
jgi:RNA-directed DNA polymerase